MNFQRLTLTLSCLIVMILAFQNCSRSNSPVVFNQSSSIQETADSSPGNGEPYDGKIYVLTGNQCSDGTNIQAKIKLTTDTASLIRDNCQEIAPIVLAPSEYSLDPADQATLYYRSQVFQMIGTKIDVSLASNIQGYTYMMKYDFGTPSNDATNRHQSKFQLYEDGKPLGPPHSTDVQMRDLGQGRFNYWMGHLHFTTSDNSDPRTNGRIYTYDLSAPTW